RVQLKMRSVRGEIYLGFFAQGSHSVVNIPSGCAISSPSINKTVEELRAVLAGFPEPEMLPQIDITSGDDGDVLIVFHYDGIDRDRICNFLHGQSNRLSLVRGIFLQSGRKNTILPVSGLESTSYSVSDKIFKGLHGMRLKTSRGGFSQVNYRQNSVLIDLVLQWIDPRGEERILDLYCGNGNFSLPVARYAAEVTGFEEYEQSIKDAEDNRLSNKLANAKFECIDSVKGLKRLTASDQNFPVVILDPPRSGAPKAVELIPLIKPLKIIYISCDPATLARDISKLREFDYLVTKSRPVDMFPQTYHIESVTLLERREP
ncbi:MAG: 23S rRNA (uracil(1939)-C(5))-methyltransferase RlmD, partial [Deltaproteobacteria bacterium]